MIANSFRYVNRMMNIAYLTGLVRHDKDNPRVFYLSHTANPSLDIPLHLPHPDFSLPPQGQLRTVLAHVRGKTGEYGQTVQADVISVTSASVLNIPPMTNYLLGFTKRLPKSKLPEGLPYNSSGLIKEEWLEQIKSIEDLRPEEKAVIELYEQQSGRIRGRFDSNSNVVLIAGIVDRASYIPPGAHQSHGYGMVLLRQHKDRALVVPVRLVSNKVATILEKIRPSAPVSLKGRLRRKIIPTPDGQGILSDVVMVETDMLSPADDRQILPPPPEWMVDYVRRPDAQDEAEVEAEHAEAREQS